MAAKDIFLFLVGLFLVFITFPTAYYVSAALGYLLGIIALGIGIYMSAKRKGKLPLALGVILSALSFIVLLVTATIHGVAYATYEALKNVTQERFISSTLGKPVKVDDLIITVTDVEEGKYIKSGESYYEAKPGYKVVVVRLKIFNNSNKIKNLFDIYDFVLVTNYGKSYSRVYPIDLKWIIEPTDEIKVNAIEVSQNTVSSIAPHSYAIVDVLFQIPENEVPTKLFFKVGILPAYQVSVDLR